jgi:AraC family ethanolamine operon transcriptional activator
MARSITAVLHQADDFQDALSGLGDIRVVVTGQGRLQVRITHITLQHLQLLTVRENLPRIAFIRIPDNTVLLSFPLGGQTAPVWAGFKIPAEELIVVCGGESLHTRTDGASHWCAIRLSLPEFMRLRRAVTGETSRLPGAICTWRPQRSARNTLFQLLTAASRAAQAQSVVLTMDQAVHGLEQQIIHCTLNCLTGAPAIVETPTAHRQRELASRFEALLQCHRQRKLPAPYLAGTLGVSGRALRRCCELHLGMSPLSYIRLHRMHWAYRALQNGASHALRVSDLAERYGFRHPSRFARAYRELFGELPSWTLRGGRPRNRRTDLATRGSGKQPTNRLIWPN